MNDFFVPFILGIFIVVLGITNMKGNINSLHWYHRKRVTEENRKPFGKLVGLGTIIIGIALIICSILFFIADRSQILMLETVSNILLILSLILGLGLNFYAMFKYNKGIF